MSPNNTSVLLIYTGGTIGMIENAETGALESFNFEHLQKHVPELQNFTFRIDTYQFDPPMDSSDMDPDAWRKLVRIISDNYNQYTGFVILHGTDTMAYTAAALRFMLNNLTTPVIYTGSQLPIGKIRTDGKENLITAIEIAAAKEIADVVVVTCHWGVEDTYNVTDGVKALAQKIIAWGGDVIIGTHPHVAQTMEYLPRPDGTQGFVFYSLGNFISAQTDNMNLIGDLADFNIVAKEDGSVTIEDVKVSPVITQFDDGRESNLRLYPYSMYTDELAAQHGLPYCSSSTGPSYQVWSMEKIRELFDTSVPEQFRNYN